MKNKNRLFVLWVGGIEVNDYLLNNEEVSELAKKYKDEGYDDVKIEEVIKNEKRDTKNKRI